MSDIDMSLVKFDEKGLVPIVVQDSISAEVLMTAWANEESLKLTAISGKLTLWSRSRKEIWEKGSTSGNVIKVIEFR
ncbi:MAG: bifunctional phosphoribosyl-AMP cyclohydrolase/phosphoribosyl-ATP pyrophosphatase, partial [Synergistaceae bacterium]|nr:bifunctional phosphoribosyl-AMP cyclohydrolase/phosphoribosyl-ATP pyrophosphatase [Synergistaceae bacterium]